MAEPAAVLSPSGPFALPSRPEAPGEPAPLPLGRHGLPREYVRTHQRNRILAGAVAAISVSGYRAATVTGIVAAAGVSRATFYEYFPDGEACFLAAYEEAVAWLEREGAAALAGVPNWAAKVAAATDFALGALVADPDLARFLIVEIPAAGPSATGRQRELVDRLSRALAAGRVESTAGAELPANLETALIGGAASVIARRLQAGGYDRLPALAPEITWLLLVPYLGAAAAQQATGG